MPQSLLQKLRSYAVSNSLFEPTDLCDAFERLKFVQADPIRAPARAQDLILRLRVKDYRAGDLERKYPSLDLEEDFLYAYGFLTRDVYRLLHPRRTSDLPDFERRVLEKVIEESGGLHPTKLEEHFGRDRIVNAWGGSSKATTQALENLRHRGLLRIARRANGIRVYEAALPAASAENLSPPERFAELLLVMTRIFAPVAERCLQEASGRLRRWCSVPVKTKTAINDLLKAGLLEKEKLDGIDYYYPGGTLKIDEERPQAHLLAPFDPIVWDRRRFEHFWGWAYRFEAYVPAQKRIRGYYALPLLWRNEIIGWANARVEKEMLNIAAEFIGKAPDDAEFRREMEAEIERLKDFLQVKASNILN